LSSGEKQVFLILLTVLLQDGKPYILLLDEPEISLHIEWQRVLIKMIRDLNENCQIIIVTHSPSIYFKGWSDKMKRITDIVLVNLPVAAAKEIDLIKINDLKNKLVSIIQVKSDKYRFTRAAALIIDYKPKLSLMEVMNLLELLPQEYIKQSLIITAIISHINDFSDFKRFLDKLKTLQVKIRDLNFFEMMTKVPSIESGIELINNIQDFDLQPNEHIFQVLLRKAHNKKEIDLVEATRKYYNIPLSNDYVNQLKLRMRT
jgi:wyosine [tRNA(Phe)-imidazoG37] synthetase (radical SAM superfamily)